MTNGSASMPDHHSPVPPNAVQRSYQSHRPYACACVYSFIPSFIRSFIHSAHPFTLLQTSALEHKDILKRTSPLITASRSPFSQRGALSSHLGGNPPSSRHSPAAEVEDFSCLIRSIPKEGTEPLFCSGSSPQWHGAHSSVWPQPQGNLFNKRGLGTQF